MQGWIKLYRKLMDWEWYKDSHMVHLFIHLLLNANHEEMKWKGLIIKRGQLVTGRIKLSESTGISQRSIRTCINKLKSTNNITIKTTNKFTIITICNYDNYQRSLNNIDQQTEPHTDHQVTNNRPTTDHKQELKNDNNGKKSVVSKKNFRHSPPDHTDENLVYDKTEDSFLVKDNKPTKVKGGAATFMNSEVADFESFKKLCAEPYFEGIDLEFYHTYIKNWAGDKKKSNWLGYMKNWIMKDIKDKKEVRIEIEVDNYRYRTASYE